MTGTTVSGLSALGSDLRHHDPDRYLATLFAPADRREALFALYAFDHEIAKVKRLTREPMAGLIRLQWWRDALAGIGQGDVLAHPVVQGLEPAIRSQGLDRTLLEAAILAREREIEEPPPKEMADFECHVASTNGGIVKAAVLLLGANDPGILTAADRLGGCLGLLERLRSFGSERDGSQPWLPEALLREHGRSESLREALAVRAKSHLDEARKERSSISRNLLPAFFPGTLAAVHLSNVERPQQSPAAAAAPFRLLWHWLRCSF